MLIGLFISFTVTAFKPTTEVKLGSGIYSLWLADTDATRVQGLSDVEKLDLNGGLLMDYGYDDTHGIWMKDMYMSLDIIWLDSDKKIIYIVKNAPPEVPVKTVYKPQSPARYVIELPAGSVDKSAIKVGGTAEFTIKV